MSWTPELYIGSMRPWPDAVRVVRSQTDESMLYAPERTCKVVSQPQDMWECECEKAWWHGGAPNYCPNCGRNVIVTNADCEYSANSIEGISNPDHLVS